MPGYPTLTEIEIKWRKSGSGVCVIVEGETELEDAWFYNQWFGDRAREVTFFPQNGWMEVVSAVAALRATLGNKSVYGIIDNDFNPRTTYPPMPHDGILRTLKCTLENYLLNPNCWFEYIRQHTRRIPIAGWTTPEDVVITIEHLYRECIPLTAYNMTLRIAREENYEAFILLPQADRTHKEHPKALSGMGDILTHLHRIETLMGITDNHLGRAYTMFVKVWDQASLSALEEVISGKHVLTLLKERFPVRFSGKQAWDNILDAYMYICPDPPEDLKILIDLIIQDAHS